MTGTRPDSAEEHGKEHCSDDRDRQAASRATARAIALSRFLVRIGSTFGAGDGVPMAVIREGCIGAGGVGRHRRPARHRFLSTDDSAAEDAGCCIASAHHASHATTARVHVSGERRCMSATCETATCPDAHPAPTEVGHRRLKRPRSHPVRTRTLQPHVRGR
jgi:hypothetical protein